MFTRSVSPEQAPDKPTYVEIEFERGDPIAIDGYRLSPATLLTRLNELAGANGERQCCGLKLFANCDCWQAHEWHDGPYS